MSLLNTITTGCENKPPRLIVYGIEGIGKSTFAASAPNPIFIQTEDGLSSINAAKFPLSKNYEQVLDQLKAILNDEHSFNTLVIDSLDWLEHLIWDKVCQDFGVRNIEKADGGFGRGYMQALTHWRAITSLLDEIRGKRNMIIILVAHSKVERFEDPENAAYDRYAPRLHKLASSLVCEWVDAILFATRHIRVDKEAGKATAIGANGGERVLRTTGSPACVAKNRYGLPEEIELSWQTFIEALTK